MVELPSSVADPVRAAVFTAYDGRPGWKSLRLGASQLFRKCDRALWYDFRWAGAEDPPGAQQQRRFDRGGRDEVQTVEDLRAAGMHVETVDPATGYQFGAELLGGHAVHYADGFVIGVPGAEKTRHLLEAKGLKASRFRAIVKKGVEEAEPSHWQQLQVGMLAHGVERCLYVIVNKDDDDLHSARIHLDRAKADAYVDRMRRAIYADAPPTKISDDPTHFDCRYCPAAGVCHFGEEPKHNCRTCALSRSHEGGLWSCDKAEAGGMLAPIGKDVQRDSWPCWERRPSVR